MPDTQHPLHNIPLTKKSLGQHWLHDQGVLLAMVQAGQVTEQDTVVEIGPGLGTLTSLLVERAQKVVALEFDADLARDLPQRVHAANLEVHFADCLAFNYADLPKDYVVVANIPYYLTSNLLRVLSESPNPPRVIALLVQKEVAERVAAGPGKMSLLSVSVQRFYQASLGQIVPAALFTPPPKVDSQIIIMVRRPQPLFPDIDQKAFFRVVKAGFSQRRKKLRSSISAGLRCPKPVASTVLQQAHISPDARPQELSLEQWHALYIAAVAAELL